MSPAAAPPTGIDGPGDRLEPGTPGSVTVGAQAHADLDRRVAGILEVAAQVRTGVPIRELTDLLPQGAPGTPEHLRDWLASRPGLARLWGDRAFSPSLEAQAPDLGRLRRGEEYWEAAQELARSSFRPVRSCLLALGVTGSSAYREPEAGDDLDLLAITKPGTLWLFLTYAFLALRWGRIPRIDGVRASVCLNYVWDAGTARREFATTQDFLFAREALTVRAILGETFYARLLGEASWMREEVPRLYAARSDAGRLEPPPPAPVVLRILNLCLYPFLAAYLQAQALRRNARLRRQGAFEELFRSETRLGSLSYASGRFERVRAGYASSPSGRSPSRRSARPGEVRATTHAPTSSAPGG